MIEANKFYKRKDFIQSGEEWRDDIKHEEVQCEEKDLVEVEWNAMQQDWVATL